MDRKFDEIQITDIQVGERPDVHTDGTMVGAQEKNIIAGGNEDFCNLIRGCVVGICLNFKINLEI